MMTTKQPSGAFVSKLPCDQDRAGLNAELGLQDKFEIPPFLRAPERGTRLATENMIVAIDNKIAKLAKLGLRPHPNLIGYRLELMEQLNNNGPYRVRWSSGVF